MRTDANPYGWTRRELSCPSPWTSLSSEVRILTEVNFPSLPTGPQISPIDRQLHPGQEIGASKVVSQVGPALSPSYVWVFGRGGRRHGRQFSAGGIALIVNHIRFAIKFGLRLYLARRQIKSKD
jgi:hypothetical protein